MFGRERQESRRAGEEETGGLHTFPFPRVPVSWREKEDS